MKNYDVFLLGLYDAILSDVASWYPEDATEWRWTQARLRYLVKTQGLRFLTIGLVAQGKHLDKCLAEGAFTFASELKMARWKGHAIPDLFRRLYARVFMKNSGKLRLDVDLFAVSVLRQLHYAAKKVRMECNEHDTIETVREFFDIEKTIRPPSYDWDGDRMCFATVTRPSLSRVDDQLQNRGDRVEQLAFLFHAPTGESIDDPVEVFRDFTSRYPRLLDTIQRVADECSSALGGFEASKIIPKHGPGAVSDSCGESKFDFPHWSDKLAGLFPAEDFAYYNAASVWNDSEDGGPLLSKGEPPSKLIAVPKTQKGPRLIASEPTAHQWIQQGILGMLIPKMDKTWLKYCVSIRDQQPSRDLALLASTQCHLSTVDLSSASDRVSCWLVERIFRGNEGFLSMMHAARTRWLVQTLDKKLPKFSRMRKFTTMGSALTFPVQTIIYAIICVGVDIWAGEAPEVGGLRRLMNDPTRFSSRRFSSRTIEASKRIRVFGDDIIHPVESTPLLVETLSCLGLKVNLHKTFLSGFFRESCGLDAYAGVDVTPTYVNELPIKTEPESLISVIESSNNFHLRGLWRTADYLKNTLPQWVRKDLAVKGIGSGAFGLVSFVGADVSHLKQRWNDQLHHWDSLTLAPLMKGRRKSIRGSAALLQYFTENPQPTTKWVNGVGLRAPDRKSVV